MKTLEKSNPYSPNGGYVAAQVKFPSGYYATWSGQFENVERAIEKMKVVIPVTC